MSYLDCDRHPLFLDLGMFSSLILALGLTLSFADGEPQTGALFQTLPEDGVWAKYDVAVKIDEMALHGMLPSREDGCLLRWSPQCRG